MCSPSLRSIQGPGVRGADAELCGFKSNHPATTLTPVPSPQGRGERWHHSRCENTGRATGHQHHSRCETSGGGDAARSPLSHRGEGSGVRGTDAERYASRIPAPPTPSPRSPLRKGEGNAGIARRGKILAAHEATSTPPGAKPLAGEGMQHNLPSLSRRGKYGRGLHLSERDVRVRPRRKRTPPAHSFPGRRPKSGASVSWPRSMIERRMERVRENRS
jgi:hypothetical protein